ncbi:MAG: hypothetical protein HN348_19245 [Proteobacteria bacterium]|nr:hypothetical protein [Pseudomonadota bacterium]
MTVLAACPADMVAGPCWRRARFPQQSIQPPFGVYFGWAVFDGWLGFNASVKVVSNAHGILVGTNLPMPIGFKTFFRIGVGLGLGKGIVEWTDLAFWACIHLNNDVVWELISGRQAAAANRHKDEGSEDY